MAKLSEYLKDASITQRRFAERVGISPSYLNEIAQELKTPGLDLALRIHSETGGLVELQSLVRSPSSDASKDGSQRDGSLPSKEVGNDAVTFQGDSAA